MQYEVEERLRLSEPQPLISRRIQLKYVPSCHEPVKLEYKDRKDGHAQNVNRHGQQEVQRVIEIQSLGKDVANVHMPSIRRAEITSA